MKYAAKNVILQIEELELEVKHRFKIKEGQETTLPASFPFIFGIKSRIPGSISPYYSEFKRTSTIATIVHLHSENSCQHH